MAQQKTSEFYWACRNGDEETAKKLIARLKPKDINRMEPNGSTALHAASFHGHANIVQILLKHGADTKISNKYKKIPIEEAATSQIRALFEQADADDDDDDDDDDHVPKSDCYQVYPNTDGMDKSTLAIRIFIARLKSYHSHKYGIAAKTNIDELQQKIRETCNNEQHLKHILHYFGLFRDTGDFDHLLQLYSTDSNSFYMVCNDDTFHVEIYKNLRRYDKQRVKGRLYRSSRISPKDLQLFQWALNHRNCLLETRKCISTTLEHDDVVSITPDRSVFEECLFQFDLPDQKCCTVINITEYSVFQGETEVLIVPGTFFSVTDIKKTKNNLMVITLVNVPINESDMKNGLKEFSKTQ